MSKDIQIYLVGGAVRDKLLGLAVCDRDWLVVGASAEQMLAWGYQQIGQHFPVFLHPKTREQYALARLERKTAKGYKGFFVNANKTVTLKQDLARRDLTINAMAEDQHGRLIDYFGGQRDLKRRLLRHVSDAFTEDAVRILRVARFAAKYHQYGFNVATQTQQLMKQMVDNGEVDALVPERVWHEIEMALTYPTVSPFFQVLSQCGALATILAPLSAKHQAKTNVFVFLDQLSADGAVKWALLLCFMGQQAAQQINKKLKPPKHYQQLAMISMRWHIFAKTLFEQSAPEIVHFYQSVDAYRRQHRFRQLLMVFGRQGIDCEKITALYNKLLKIDIGQTTGKDTATYIREKRRQIVNQFLEAQKSL